MIICEATLNKENFDPFVFILHFPKVHLPFCHSKEESKKGERNNYDKSPGIDDTSLKIILFSNIVQLQCAI